MSTLALDRLDSLRLGRGKGYEPGVTALIRQTLRPGDVFVDVGAHIGWHSLAAAEAVGRDGIVIALEPSPENYEILMRNLKHAEALAIPLRLAATEWPGHERLFHNPKNTGDNRLCAMPGWASVLVATIRLDDLLRCYGYKAALVKIDTQGAEIRVLAGAAGIMGMGVPMIVEFFPSGIVAAGGLTARSRISPTISCSKRRWQRI
jgi:FkbM family methyltransferase